tara:strand:+ start:412 stop:780 length:369 start_codon:yes stop_codon:yes gene_type:complete
MDWFKDNWDKVLSLVIGGIAGYFVAIRAVDSEIAQLRTDLSTLKTEVDTAIKPDVEKIDGHEQSIGDLTRRTASLEQADRAVSIYQLNLEARLKQAQADTVTELNEMIDKIQAQKRATSGAP